MNGLDTQELESQAGAHDIGDRIRRAHFVKVHFFYGNVVHGRFGFAQAAEHR